MHPEAGGRAAVLLQAGAIPGGYGVALLQTLLALAAVCILAWVVLRWASQKGLGIGATGKHVKVLERLPLDARRTLWVLKIADRILLIGAGDHGSPSTLAEIAAKDLPALDAPPKKSFVELLRAKPGDAPAVPPREEPAAREPEA